MGNCYSWYVKFLIDNSIAHDCMCDIGILPPPGTTYDQFIICQPFFAGFTSVSFDIM